MGDIFGSSSSGGGSTMIILLGGAACMCSLSSALAGYAWYDNWLCDTNEKLGRECKPKETSSPSPLNDGPSEDDPPSNDGPSNVGDDASGGGGDGKNNNNNNNDDDDKGEKCDKYKVQLGYIPYQKEASGPEREIYKSSDGKVKSGKKVKVKDDIFKQCKKQYYCKIGGKLYAMVDGNKGLYQATGIINSKDDTLEPWDIGGNQKLFQKFKMGEKAKLGSKNVTINDECGDCGSCEVSLFTGKETGSQPKTWESIEHEKKYTLKSR